MKKTLLSILTILIMLISQSCSETNDNDNPNDYTNINNTYAFGILKKLKGIWNGPVNSTTALGSYPEYIVDFRPISSNQISAKNELDTLNSIFMSFFIAKYNNQYRVCFRNGGEFAGLNRVSYFLADSISETSSLSYYRFSEVLIGKNRAYTEAIFKDDSLILKSYTNQYNTLPTAVLHMTWSAKRMDTTSCTDATNTFNFPQKTLTRDFSTSFSGFSEAIFYTPVDDPYNEMSQPYLGQSNISYSFDATHVPSPTKKVFLLITTQPLITGFIFDPNNLRYRSRYIILDASDLNYQFNYMHPGNYYLYAFYDNDDNFIINSGDWMTLSNTSFSLSNLGTTSASTIVNFTIP